MGVGRNLLGRNPKAQLTCKRCERTNNSVRLVEHGLDDIALCKPCFKQIVLNVETVVDNE